MPSGRTLAMDALTRIVHLLDRSLAESYRVRAFTRAADVLRSIDDETLDRLVASGRLTDLDGIGDVTAAVITEAARGEVPSYLSKLEQDTVVPITPAGAAVLRALRGDLHSHTRWSDGGASVEAMVGAAIALGHDYLVVTDHSPRLTVAHGLDRHRLLEQLDEIDALRARFAPFRILTGMEVDILEDGTLDADDDILGRLDVVVASVHSKLRMERGAMTRRMVLAVANPHVDVLGHCTGRLLKGRGRPESDFDADLVFAACLRFDKAVEINCRPERLDPPMRLLHRAVELGCRFAIDSDAHATGQLEWLPYGANRAAEAAVPMERIVNAMDADALLAWTASHAA